MKFSGVITKDQGNVHAKGQGQRSKVKVTVAELPTCTHFVYFVHKNGNMKIVHRIEAFVHKMKFKFLLEFQRMA